jgi:uncharacterized membrane protein
MRRIIQFIASAVGVIGLADAIYLTVHHYTATAVPCGLTGGCETVLTSAYAEIFGLPLGVYGAAAYFTAFALAFLAAYGNDLAWKLFGVLATTMVLFSAWLIFVQAYYINAWCQFCLLSALTSTTLFVLYIVSLVMRPSSDEALDPSDIR